MATVDRVEPSTEKICIGCNLPKPRDAFYAQPSAPDGLRKRCKTCYSRMSDERRRGERPKKKPGPTGSLQRVPFALPDDTVKWVPAPERWAVAKATSQKEVAAAEAQLLAADATCRVLVFSYLTSSVTLPRACINRDIDWVVCNRPQSGCDGIQRSLAEQCQAAGVPFFCFDEIGLLPIDGRVWAQVP